MELYKEPAQIGLPCVRPLLQDIVQIDAVHCDLLYGLLHTVALLSVERYEYRVSCDIPVELAREKPLRLREVYLNAECTFIEVCGPGSASVLRGLQHHSSVGAFVSIVQPGRYKHRIETSNRRHALLVRRKHCALCGTQQGRGLPVIKIRCRLAQDAVGYSVYRHALYAVVRSVAFFPEAYVISVVVLRLCHAEIGAVGRLYIISHVAERILYIRRRSKRHPAVERKIPLIKGRKRHPSEIRPMRIALSCVCMLRPRTVGYLAVRVVAMAEL